MGIRVWDNAAGFHLAAPSVETESERGRRSVTTATPVPETDARDRALQNADSYATTSLPMPALLSVAIRCLPVSRHAMTAMHQEETDAVAYAPWRTGTRARAIPAADQSAIRHAVMGTGLAKSSATMVMPCRMTAARRTVWSSVDTLAMGAIQDPPMCV